MILAFAAFAAFAADLPLPEVRPTPAERFGTTGFRATLPSKGASVSTRLAFVQDFDGPTIGELTLRGHYATQGFGLAVETVATAGASDIWGSAGFGNTTVDVRGMFGRGSTHAIGLRGILPTGLRSGPHGNVAWWGTVPLSTRPALGLSLAYEGAIPRLVWNVRVGLVQYYDWLGPSLDLSLIVATVQPLGNQWWIVGEGEVYYGVSPVHARGMVRHTFAHGWTADAGVSVPVPAIFQDPTLQLLGRVEKRW